MLAFSWFRSGDALTEAPVVPHDATQSPRNAYTHIYILVPILLAVIALLVAGGLFRPQAGQGELLEPEFPIWESLRAHRLV